VIDAGNARIGKGIELFDEGKLEEAAEIFKKVIDQWPQSGLASFELGLTKYHLQEKAAGRLIPKFSNKDADDPSRPSDEVLELYRVARTHDPMNRNAYQGPGVGQNLAMMARVVLPSYRKLADLSARKIDGRQLARFGVGSQEVGLHDYALFSLQVNTAVRGRFAPSDLKIIKKSLMGLVDDKTVDEIAEFLDAEQLQLHKFGFGNGNDDGNDDGGDEDDDGGNDNQ